MKRTSRSAAAALFLALVAASARAQTSSQAIQFTPVGGAEEGEPVDLVATFNSQVDAVSGQLFVRPIGQSSYLPLPLQINGNQIQGRIPPSLIAAPGVEYFLSVTDEENTTVTFPPSSPQSNPVRLAVASRAGVFTLRVISPSSGTAVADPRPTLRFEFAGGGGLEPGGLRVFVDRREVTGACRVEAADILCAVPWELALGTHSVTAAARGRSGAWARPLDYSFIRTKEAARTAPSGPLKGRVLAGGGWYRLERSPQSTAYLPYPVRGNRTLPTLELDADWTSLGEAMRLRVEQTSLDRFEQPGPGTYALSFKGASHEVELGDSQRGWTDMGLSANRVRGLRARGWRGSSASVEAVGGLTRRAVEDRDFNTATYAQYAYGTKASVSPAKALTVTGYGLEVRDDPGSVSINTFAIPVANRVGGAEAAAALPWGFKASGELAFNRYSPNLRLGDAGRGRGWQVKLSQARQTYNWTGIYRKTTPAFVSLGNYLVQSDYNGFDGNGSLRPFGNKLMLSIFGQSYRDNTEGTKTATFRLGRYQVNLYGQPFAKGPQFQGGVGQQVQTTRFVAAAASENRMLNWSAGLNQTFGAFRVGAMLNSTGNRTVVGSAFSRDFESRYWSGNVGWFGRRGSLQANGGYTASRDLTSGTRTKSLSATLRGSVRLESFEGEAAVTEGRGRDTAATNSTRQSNWSFSGTWRYEPKRFWRLKGERVSYSDFIRPRQSYQEGVASLAWGLEF